MKCLRVLPLVVLAAIILSLAVLPASAELRQWTDEKGVKHFSNKKELPGDVSVERSWEEKENRPDAERSYQKPSSYTRPRSGPGTTKQKKVDPGFESKADILKKTRSRKEDLKELFERIYTKRRYVKRQGKKDIDRIRRLAGEIEALEKSGAADSGRIKQLKEESDAAKERLFNENLRTRKGVGEDIREYKKIEAEIKALQKRL